MRTAYFSGHATRNDGHALHMPAAGEEPREVYGGEKREFEKIVNPWLLDCALIGAVPQIEGEAVLWVRKSPGPWTILSFWDRSSDTRYGCCASFVLKGELNFSDAVERARYHFPTLFERFTFKVHERPA